MTASSSRITKVLFLLLALIGSGRSIAYFLFPSQQETTALRRLAVSPLPRVFDRPHYFMHRSASYFDENDAAQEFTESEIHRHFSGGPWHHKIVSRHMFLYGFRRYPALFELHAQSVYCREIPKRESAENDSPEGAAVAKPSRILFQWRHKEKQQSGTDAEREIKCP